MSDIVIRAENLGKQFNIGTLQKYDTLRDRIAASFRRNAKSEVQKAKSEDSFWALKDINFEIKQGEVVGVIGRNGAGKSTLLKILSKITEPTVGRVELHGRVGSLLEVGTGFHPELTGRENVFLNGAILGMRREEIKRRFDEIVAFSEVERFIDTPVKHYSTGMYMRLAFAVAAFMEPEILLVDEVLAVGDSQFQKKCVDKMGEVAKEGRTVLFVSHNMAAVEALCKKGIILEKGTVIYKGTSQNTIEAYLNNHTVTENEIEYSDLDEAPGNENIRIKSFKVLPYIGQILNMDSGVKFCLEFINFKEGIDLDATFELVASNDLKVFHRGCLISQKKDSKQGYYYVEGFLPPFLLNAGKYKLNLIFGENQRYLLYKIDDILSFEIENTLTGKGSNFTKTPGIIYPNLNWECSFRKREE